MIMTKYKFLIITVLCLVGCRIYAQESSKTVQPTTTANACVIDSLKQVLKEKNKRIQTLSNEKDGLMSLYNGVQSEKSKKDEEIKLLKQELKLKGDTIQEHLETVKSLRRDLIEIAVNFIYIPYDKYSIDNIAIPAFNKTEGTSFYSKNQIVLTLLKNYESDITTLIEFLSNTPKNLGYFSGIKEQNAKLALEKLSASPLYTQYNQYDVWEETYLGKIICKIKKALNGPVDKLPEQFNAIQAELQERLNAN